MNYVLTLVQVIELRINVAREIRACIHKALNTEEQALSWIEVDTHRPEGNIELDNITWWYLFFFIVRVEWDQGRASCWILCTMGRSEDPSWSSVLWYQFRQLPHGTSI